VVADDVGEVVVGVPRSLQHAHGHGPHAQLVAAVRGAPLEGDVVPAGDDVGGSGPAGQRVAAGHVVVVQMGLEDHRRLDAQLLQQRFDPVDIALWVDHDRAGAVTDDVAAVTQVRGLDDIDAHAASWGLSTCLFVRTLGG